MTNMRQTSQNDKSSSDLQESLPIHGRLGQFAKMLLDKPTETYFPLDNVQFKKSQDCDQIYLDQLSIKASPIYQSQSLFDQTAKLVWKLGEAELT